VCRESPDRGEEFQHVSAIAVAMAPMAFTKAFPVGTLGTWGLEAETPELAAMRNYAGGFHLCLKNTENGLHMVA
jgi:hypothetical protein